MKTFKYIATAMLVCASLSLCACDDDDDEDDEVVEEDYSYVESAAGNYTVTLTGYNEACNEILAEAQTGSAKVTCDNDNVEFIFDGDTYSMSNYVEAANGFFFNVNSITVDDAKLVGFDIFQVTLSNGSVAYKHGCYAKSDKQFVFYMKTTIDGQIVVFEFNCIKK